MRYGLLLLGEHSPERLVRMARLAEASGFEHFWSADEKFFRDPYVSLAHIAGQTSKIKLGICVTDPFTRHPALTAMTMATLDEISEGRGILGIGAGFSGLEAMGIKRPKMVTALREAVELIRRLWCGETVTYQGETVTFSNGQLNFQPRPDIPILIATGGRQILRVAGEIADMVMLGDLASAFVIEPAIKEVEAGAARAGRALTSIPLISRVNLILSDDIAAVRDVMKPWILVSLWHTYPNWKYFFFYTPELEERLRPFRDFIEARGGKPRNVGDHALVSPYRDLVTDEMVRHSALAGNADDIVEQIVEIAGTGVNSITLYPMPLHGQDPETVLQRFVEDVLPAAQAVLSTSPSLGE